MNSLQDEVFDYLTNGEGSTRDRKAALKKLITSNFFADGDTVAESEEQIAQYLSSAHGFCAAGVERFRRTLGLEERIQTLELVVRVDISPESGMATSVLNNPSPGVVDDIVSFFFDGPLGERVYFGAPQLSGEYLEYNVVRVMNVAKAAPVKKAAAKKAPAKKAVAKKLAAKKAPARRR